MINEETLCLQAIITLNVKNIDVLSLKTLS